MTNQSHSAEEVVMEVMRHFGFRRNYQVAEYFDVTPQTLSGWIKTGEIPPKHLMKYASEILNAKEINKVDESNRELVSGDSLTQKEILINSRKFSWPRTKRILIENVRVLFGLPILTTLLMSIYVFWIANPVYTSIAKVLPISEDRSSSSGFFIVDRKSTRLNSSHRCISYAVFCLKKKTRNQEQY